MIRVAAVADVHYDLGCRNRLKSFFESLKGKADILLIAGDLTRSGAVDEAEVFAEDIRGTPIPVVSILGNHDYHQNKENEIREILRKAGVITLDRSSTVIEVQGKRIGVMGIKGFGGGFGGACATEFGEPETKAFARYTKDQAESLRRGLSELECDYRFVLLHYSPVENTLLGERREVYPFLGSYLLGEAVDMAGADAVFHGHAHFGTERGGTFGGIPVRNVAQMVIRHAYNIYAFNHSRNWKRGEN